MCIPIVKTVTIFLNKFQQFPTTLYCLVMLDLLSYAGMDQGIAIGLGSKLCAFCILFEKKTPMKLITWGRY